METLKLSVSGMTCNHCKMTVEKNVSKLGKFESVIANPVTNTLEIQGENINLKTIEETIEQLGYKYNGVISK